MQEKVNEKVSIISSYSRDNGLVMPRKMRWQGRDYTFKTQSYRGKWKNGRDLIHAFYVSDGIMDFRLNLNTDNLIWTLEEVTDGSAT